MKINKQAERSRQWLAEALLKLMQSTPFDKITITDISNVAGVSRLTFYRNFESKEQILLFYFESLFTEYKTGINKDMGLRAVLTHSFVYIKREKALIQMVMNQGLASLIQQPFDDYFRKVLEDISLPKEVTHFQKRFLAGGIFFVIMDWIQDEKEMTPEDIADEILCLVDMK